MMRRPVPAGLPFAGQATRRRHYATVHTTNHQEGNGQLTWGKLSGTLADCEQNCRVTDEFSRTRFPPSKARGHLVFPIPGVKKEGEGKSRGFN